MKKDYKRVEDATFVNPYNFVPLQDSCIKKSYFDPDTSERLTGWLDCQLTLKTPIFIPNTSKEFRDDNNVKGLEFFSYDNLDRPEIADDLSAFEAPDSPVIPGSEIRGMFRSAFEAVTNSCLSTLDFNQQLFKRTSQPAKQGQLNYLNEKWIIIKCNRIVIKEDIIQQKHGVLIIDGVEYKEGEKVFYEFETIGKSKKVTAISKNKNDGFQNKGYIHISDLGERKKGESIFIKKEHESIVLNPNDVPEILNNLIENILMYQTSNNQTKDHKHYVHLGNNKIVSIDALVNKYKNENWPLQKFNSELQKKYMAVFEYLKSAFIYYSEHEVKDSKKYYLSPAAINREMFYNRLPDIIDSSHLPCDDPNNLCKSCKLFGMVGKKNAVASKIRITDAHVDEKFKSEIKFDPPVTLLELSSPKITATEFYLKKTDSDLAVWNYDYAQQWGRDKKPDGKPIVIIKDKTGYHAQIRGRKFFWHHKKAINSSPWENKKPVSERSVRVRPLRKGTFNFKVYFNKITIDELKTLMWVLEIGGNSTHAHKIGMGKPIGLGSIQIQVVQHRARVRKFQKDDSANILDYNIPSYSIIDYKGIESTLFLLHEFLKVTKFDNGHYNIEYPKNVLNPGEEEKSYEWFVANRVTKWEADGMKNIIDQPLPLVMEDQTLKKYINLKKIKKN